MKKSILFIGVLCFACLGYSQEGSRPYIEVFGESEMEVSPNEIYVRVDLREKDKKGKESIAETEATLFSTLERIGVDLEKEVSIIDLSSNFKYYFLKKTDVYLSKEYEVVLKDAKSVGELILALEKVNISNVSINRIDHSDLEGFKRETKIEAMKLAKEKATYLATSIGQDIGGAILISEVEQEENLSYLRGVSAGLNVRGSRSYFFNDKTERPQVEFEKIKIKQKIAVRFELK